MATVTPNFNWPVPTSTDLVKDGATAIEALGDAIDTSMVDLKGGTTGQVLAKASSADMDFSWTDANPGDITGVTATSPLTGGGTSGTVTVGIQDATTSQKGAVQLTDSTSSTSTTTAATPNSVKTTYDLANSAYVPAFTNNYYAGKNKIINGDFGVWQRGTSFTVSTSLIYTADRFYTLAGAATASRQTFTPGTAPVAGYEGQYYWNQVITANSQNYEFGQRVENARTFAGQTTTVSFWARSTVGAQTMNIEPIQNFGTGGSPSSSVGPGGQTWTPNSSWQRFTFTFVMPSVSGKTFGTNNDSYIQFKLGQYTTTATNTSVDIWGVQWEAGSTATPFVTASGGSQEGELSLCQRYYVRYTGVGSSPQVLTAGISVTSTLCNSWVNMPVTMRTTPTAVEFSNLNVTDLVNYNLAVSNVTVDANTSTPSFFFGTITHASSATVNRLAVIRGQNSTGYLGISAEL